MTVLAVAHRAGNDLTALHAAVALGADVLEADVHRYRGRLEMRHSKALGPLPWLWDAGELTSTAVPQLLLAEMMAAHGGRSTLMLDLKGPGSVGRHVAEAIHDQAIHVGGPDAPVLVCSRWWPGVDAFGGRRWARPVLSARNQVELLRLRRRIRGARAPYGVSVHRSLLTRDVVAALHEKVELVMTWPVNDVETLDEVLALGVTGVISDESEILRAVLALPRG